jgi:hypothetical protein
MSSPFYKQSLVARRDDDTVVPKRASAGMTEKGVLALQARLLDVGDVENTDLALMS